MVVLFLVIIPNKKTKETATKIVAIEEAEIGDCIKLGRYEQDRDLKNGAEDIEWQVLDKKGNKLLVISKYALFQREFNEYNSSCYWNTSMLSEYLDSEFRNDAFMEYEKRLISLEIITADENPDYIYIGGQGSDSEDYIFLLSIEEVNRYLPNNEDRICVATDYAVSQGISSNKNNECCWWLRTIGASLVKASYVGHDGNVFTIGDRMHETSYAVRPAMWINVSEYNRIENDYNTAVEMMKSDKYDDALTLFNSIIGYKDSESNAELCDTTIKDAKYNEATELIENNKYKEAIELLGEISGYKDSDELKENCKEKKNAQDYENALGLMNDGKYEDAISEFNKIIEYKDCSKKIKECEILILDRQYNEALEFITTGEFIKAYESLILLDGYKDSIEKAESIYFDYCVEKIKNASVGEYVIYGSYEQDNNTSNGKEDIEWLVLEKKNGKALVISKYGLDCAQYNISWDDITWENCTLRRWLNDTFIEKAFSEEEKALIPTVTLSADKNPEYDTNPGNSTLDKVFALSVDEVSRLFNSDSGRQCEATEYAKEQGVSRSHTTCKWWLRTPGIYQSDATSIDYSGEIKYGSDVHYGYYAARPAMWIEYGE